MPGHGKKNVFDSQDECFISGCCPIDMFQYT